ncbi:Mss4-like protein [Hypomontagnella monticulosa]|nr:Mss4-like protein [Hypomontagnella monticulosa]
MAKEGGCLCGKVRISYTSEPVTKLLCHCLDCRKISGSGFSINLIVPEEGFKITSGTPKTFTKVADSGLDITGHFCGDCGTTLFRDGECFGTNKILKTGIMDDLHALDDAKPVVELFSRSRVSWVPAVPGADQKETV